MVNLGVIPIVLRWKGNRTTNEDRDKDTAIPTRSECRSMRSMLVEVFLSCAGESLLHRERPSRQTFREEKGPVKKKNLNLKP